MKRYEGTDEKCCGNCKCFLYEDIDGEGICFLDSLICYCGDCCDGWVEEQNTNNEYESATNEEKQGKI